MECEIKNVDMEEYNLVVFIQGYETVHCKWKWRGVVYVMNLSVTKVEFELNRAQTLLGYYCNKPKLEFEFDEQKNSILKLSSARVSLTSLITSRAWWAQTSLFRTHMLLPSF